MQNKSPAYCSACGAKAVGAFCTQCGAKLQEPLAQQSATNAEPTAITPQAAPKGLGFFIACAAGVLFQAAFAAASQFGFHETSADAFMPVYFGYVVFCALIWWGTYALARWKRRDPTRWMQATFFFGWIPLLIALFVPRRS